VVVCYGVFDRIIDPKETSAGREVCSSTHHLSSTLRRQFAWVGWNKVRHRGALRFLSTLDLSHHGKCATQSLK